MLRNQAEELHAAGLEMLRKSRSCAKSTDATAFADLGLKMLAEAREIFEEVRVNSVLCWLECRLKNRGGLEYQDYLDFCSRNGLDSLRREDWDRAGRELVEEWTEAG